MCTMKCDTFIFVCVCFERWMSRQYNHIHIIMQQPRYITQVKLGEYVALHRPINTNTHTLCMCSECFFSLVELFPHMVTNDVIHISCSTFSSRVQSIPRKKLNCFCFTSKMLSRYSFFPASFLSLSRWIIHLCAHRLSCIDSILLVFFFSSSSQRQTYSKISTRKCAHNQLFSRFRWTRFVWFWYSCVYSIFYEHICICSTVIMDVATYGDKLLEWKKKHNAISISNYCFSF